MSTYVASEALSKCAGKAELEELKDIPFDPTAISALQSLLLDVYALLRPKSIDYENRALLVQVIKRVVTDTFGSSNNCLSVEAYGSFVMDLFTARSDLDLSVNFDNGISNYPHNEKIFALRKLARVLGHHQKNGVFKGLLPILHARVPIVQVIDNVSGIECDISVESKDGILISQIFKLVSSIDGRFQILCYLMKLWAKAHGINSAKDCTINSLSIVTLVAFHLQTRKPAIFPPFSSLLKDGIGMPTVERNVTRYRNFGRNNQESVAELFITLLVKLASVNHLWQQGICASTWDGRWVYKLWESRKGKMSVSTMSVENFLNRSENFSRCVGKTQMNVIAKRIADSLVDISFFMRGQIDASRLKKLLFKSKEQDVFGKLPVQKVEPSKYLSFTLTNENPEKKKQRLKKRQKAPPDATNSSNDKMEEIGQKRKASTDHRTSKKARNTEPSIVNRVLPTPVLISPVHPHFINVLNRPPAYNLPQPGFVQHQLHNQVALPYSVPHPLHNQIVLPRPLPPQLHYGFPSAQTGYMQQPLPHQLHNSRPFSPYGVNINQHNFVPYPNPALPWTWNGGAK